MIVEIYLIPDTKVCFKLSGQIGVLISGCRFRCAESAMAELSGTRLKRLVDVPLRYTTTKRLSLQITTIIRAQALHYRGYLPLSSAVIGLAM